MGRYVTPHGVEIEMNDKAAAVVGYKPAKATPEPREKKPAKRAVKKSDEKSDD